ncbi:MAG: BamA/TamA family outer membrane protein [Bacteroidales bacterium]
MKKFILSKKVFLILLITIVSFPMLAQQKDTLQNNLTKQKKGTIIKKGLNFGPLPIVAYDADKGLQLGGLLNIYDFGDGALYPNPYQQFYIEASFYTKGSQFYTLSYDTKTLLPNTRFSAAATYMRDMPYDFYGFNGYESFYDNDWIKSGIDNPDLPYYTSFYRLDKQTIYLKADLTGKIGDSHFYWQAGYHFTWQKIENVDIDRMNEGKNDNKKYPTTMPTLFENYKKWGIIPEKEANGGNSSELRLGVTYDTRDIENSPNKGIWAEAQLLMAPGFLGTTNPYYRYNLVFRNYLPIVYNKLTFAYRLNYLGTIGDYAPFYTLWQYPVTGVGFDKYGVGGYRTVRGMMRSRMLGLDVGFYNAEFRWTFTEFGLLHQNIELALSAFNDGAIVTKDYDMTFDGTETDRAEYNTYIAKGKSHDQFHFTAGMGFRFIMNRNFIVAFEYGHPFDKGDGNGSFYINSGFLF